MAETTTQTIQTRIKLKYGTYSEWQNSQLALLDGELAICEIPSSTTTVADDNGQTTVVKTAPTILFKVGKGNKKFSELPWASAKAADVYDWAKASDVTLEESTKDDKAVRKLTFSTGTGTNKKTIKEVTLDYVTPAEVDALIETLAQDLADHEAATNPHKINKATVGLGNVEDKSVATIKTELTGTVTEGATGFVTGGAVHTAVEAAKTHATNAVNALADGAVATNTAGIASLTQKLTTEETTRGNADKALDERLTKIEVFFEAADHDGKDTESGKTLNDALDTLKEIQDYLNGDGTTASSVIDRISAAEDAIEDHAGRIGTLESTVADNEDKIGDLQGATSGYTAQNTIAADIQVAKSAAADAQADADRANTAIFGSADGTTAADGSLVSKVEALENTVNGAGGTDTGLVGAVTQNATDIATFNSYGIKIETSSNKLYYGGENAKTYIIFDCGGVSE